MAFALEADLEVGPREVEAIAATREQHPMLALRKFDAATSDDRPGEGLERRLERTAVAARFQQSLETATPRSTRGAQRVEARQDSVGADEIAADQVLEHGEEPMIFETSGHVDQGAD